MVNATSNKYRALFTGRSFSPSILDSSCQHDSTNTPHTSSSSPSKLLLTGQASKTGDRSNTSVLILERERERERERETEWLMQASHVALLM
jgi:hypothetical protein